MRRIWLLAIVSLTSCTFPDVTISDKPIDSSVGDSGGNDAKVDSTPADTTTDGDVTEFDGTIPDTANEDVFVPPADAPPDFGPDAKKCDQDGDGYEPIGGTCAPPPGKVDCDDLNPSANPGMPPDTYYHVPSPSTLKPAFDWDCDGVVEKQWTKLTTGCGGASLGCVERSGVDAVPACLGSLNVITCAVDSLLGCKEVKREAATQGCR